MNLGDVRQGLGNALGALNGVSVFSYLPDNIIPPSVVVGFPDSIMFHLAANDDTDSGVREIHNIHVSLYCGKADAQSSQDVMQGFLQGPNSIKKALENDRTLAGVCADLIVRSAGPFGYELVGGVAYLRFDLLIDVVG